MRTRTVGMAALLAAAPMGIAWAGVTVALKHENSKTETIIYLEGNKLRVDTTPGPDQSASTVIFDGDAQKLISLNPGKKTYSEMTPAELKSLREKASKQMQNSFAKLTPEQRKQMEQMMAKMDPEQRKKLEQMLSGAPAEPPKAQPQEDIQWKTTGGAQKVAGFSCRNFKEIRAGKIDAEGCYIPWNAGAVTKADLAPLIKMSEFMAGSGVGPRGNPFSQLTRLPGFPGEWAQVSPEGKAEDRQVVTAIKKGSVAAAEFKVPAGYSKEESPAAPKP